MRVRVHQCLVLRSQLKPWCDFPEQVFWTTRHLFRNIRTRVPTRGLALHVQVRRRLGRQHRCVEAPQLSTITFLHKTQT